MDFPDNVIEKTRDVIDVACKKTGEVARLEKLRFEKASTKLKADKDYAALGRACFDAFKDDPNAPEEFAQIIAEIKAKNEKITQISAEIAAVKNKHVCPECGVANSKTAAFCSSCGAAMKG